MQSLYDVLGVPVSATAADIHAAHRRLLIRFHPQRCFHDNDSTFLNPNEELDAARLNVVEKAYAILSDPAKRRQYDAYLAHRLRSRSAQYGPDFPRQWYGQTAWRAGAAGDDGLRSVAGGRLANAAGPASTAVVSVAPASRVSAQQAPGQPAVQQQQLNATPMTEALHGPAGSAAPQPEKDMGMPVVYTAAVSMRRQPDGTVAVQSYKSGPLPLTGSGGGVAVPSSSSSSPVSTSVKAELPRRVRVVQEQLSFTGSGDAMAALTNSLLSIVAAATTGEA